MRIQFIFFITTAITSIMLASVASAEESVSSDSKKNAIIVKLGSFTLDETRGTVLGISTVYDEDSSSVFDIEYTRKFGDNFAYGGGAAHYSNTYIRGGNAGDIDTFIVTANIKKYFDVAQYFQPFVGAGAGFSLVDVSGPVSGSASGLAASLSVGAEIPFKYVGIHLEYKYTSSSAEGETVFGQTADFEVGGSGIFAGVAVHF